jgi:DNA-binding winged helix-turn-helix (wHTH) protein
MPVRYCAEQFENDESLSSSMMKALKRTMAAEYSRELGIKVAAGQRRLALLGFRVTGAAGYGYRRMMVSPDGHRTIILKSGERKAIKTDRTVLVPGPKKEVDCIRTIFRLAVEERLAPRQIAAELNRRHIPFLNGKPWDRLPILRMLKNEKYTGCNTYGMTTKRLGSSSRRVDRQLWIRSPNAFAPIIDQDTFDRVQKLIRRRATKPKRPDEYLLQGMRRVLAREGKLTERLLRKGRGLFDHRAYCKRFGSVMRAYEMVGYKPSAQIIKNVCTIKRVRLLRQDLLLRLKQLFPDRVNFIHLPGQQQRQVVEIDGCVRVAIYICRPVENTKTGEPGWILKVHPVERHLPVLVCTVDKTLSRLVSSYFFLPFGDKIKKYRVLRESSHWLSLGRKLATLDDFCNTARAVASESERSAPYTAIDEILVAPDTWTIIFGKEELTLGPVGSAIFRILALNAGQVVSRQQLQQAVLGKVLDPLNLNAHIHYLRQKLGAKDRKRIQRVPGVGYKYVPTMGLIAED